MSDEKTTKEIRDRIEIVANATRNPETSSAISATDIETALLSDGNLLALAQRHDASIDYLRTGDLRPMIQAFKELQRRERTLQQVSSKLAARRDTASTALPGAAPQSKRH
jgi:hypothetical protein